MAVPTATPSKATVKAKALPGDATALLRAMPDHVSNFARVQADSTDAWADSNPIEEYKLTYSNGNDKDAVQLTVAQWSDSEKAQGQYTKLTGDLKGSSLANGVVKVNGDVTGQLRGEDGRVRRHAGHCSLAQRHRGVQRDRYEEFGGLGLPAVPAVDPARKSAHMCRLLQVAIFRYL